jgi:hypothetical protein
MRLTEAHKDELSHIAGDLYNAAALATFGHDMTAFLAVEHLCKQLNRWIAAVDDHPEGLK